MDTLKAICASCMRLPFFYLFVYLQNLVMIVLALPFAFVQMEYQRYYLGIFLFILKECLGSV